MAESSEDKAVDACIDDLQSVLDRLRASQRKDVADESGEYKGKNLKDASDEAYRRVKAANAAGNTDSPDDQADNKKAMAKMPEAAARTRQVERAAAARGRG
jgi:hypothetical protein